MTRAGRAIYRHLEHLAEDDASELLLRALADAWGGLIDQARLVALGDGADLGPGRALWDPAVADLWALRWNAQLSGATIPSRTVGETADAYLARVRDAVIHVRGWRRGTVEALRAQARGHLTGTRTVTVTERYQDSAWRVLVTTAADETPDPDAVEDDLGDPEAVPAGVRIVYAVTP